MEDFKLYILETADKLINLSNEKASNKPSDDKWSAKEIVGHLIDSESNNHTRFVTACLKDNLIFNGYEQNE